MSSRLANAAVYALVLIFALGATGGGFGLLPLLAGAGDGAWLVAGALALAAAGLGFTRGSPD